MIPVCKDMSVNALKRVKSCMKVDKGRGSLVTLPSKTTVNKVISVISLLIQQSIAEEVKEAGMYSVQLDTTQDLTSKNQCAIIVRYLTDVINEKLIAVIDCQSSTGENLVVLLKKVLEKNGIDIKKCIGNSTDGAANMQGQVQGIFSISQT